MEKRLYTSGQYVTHFRPDSERNPFQKIYAEKRNYLIRRIPGKDLRILDLGGGMGRMTIPLSARHRMVLADLSMSMLRLAGEAGTGFERLNCEADALCLKSGSFDGVVAIDLVPHLRSVPQVLAEIRRVLKPKGLLFIDTTNSNPLWVLGYPQYANPLRKPVRWLRTLLGGGVPPEWQGKIRHLSRRRFGRLLKQSGFDVVDWAAFGPVWCPKWFVAVCTVR
jgi:ubiquinone/menaquinone biosynthesis C-methylase UbiE